MIRKILVANRGEIAIRVMRSCYEMGIRSVAVYSTADRLSRHVLFADEAECIGGAASMDSYLNIDHIIEAAHKHKVDAIHPGYGFLSENAEFARRCTQEGFIFIGPRPETMEEMGDKISARKKMIEAGVPVVPGTEQPLQSAEEAVRVAKEIGFQDGDMIVAFDGERVTDFNSIGNHLLLANDVTVRRGGGEVTFALPDTLGPHFLKEKDIMSFLSLRQPMVVADLLADGPAVRAALQAGDSIVMVDSVLTPYFADVTSQLKLHAGDSVRIGYYRGDSLCVADVLLTSDGKLGIYSKSLIGPEHLTHIDFTLAEAIPAGLQQGWTMLYNYVRQFKLVFTKEGAKELGGFGSMGAIFPEEWIWKAFWGLTAFISVALAFMNILPIPALDGGHIMILIIEAIIRRPLSNKLKDRLQYIGFGFIVLLMVAVNANDIIKFFF